VLTVPTFAPETTLEKLLADWSRIHGDRKLIFADEGEGASSPLDKLLLVKDQPIGLLIGPEGGFSEEERQKLRAQPYVIPISLGPRILRADTASVAALAIIQASIGDWR
jgi:16S rRNA (uracil1498-N3)-methyltransferase